MNVGKTLSLFALCGLVMTGTASAATPAGTAKSRGDYRPFWQSQEAGSSYAMRSTRRSYVYRAPAASTAPVATAATPAAADATASTTAAADGARRFSYSPAPAADTTAPAPAGTGEYVHRSSSRRGTYRRPPAEQWQLPKTDGHKIGG